MSIAPIELDDAAMMPLPSLGEGHMSTLHHAGGDSSGSSSELLRQCGQRMYHEFQWTVPLPRVPKAPLLYTPSVLRDVFEAGTSIMSSELDAMKTGVLDAIPVAHYATAPREIRMTMDAVRQPVVLDPKDVELLDTDVDADLLDRRGMPSLTLLKRPLYTEIGLVPPEQRSTIRLSRLVPPHLASRSSIAGASQMSLGQGLSQQTDGGVDEFSNVVQKVNESFKFAKTVDLEFQALLDGIRVKKLGLGGAVSDTACVEITRQFWTFLFDGTNGTQQRAVWLLVCKFVRCVLQVEGEDLSDEVRTSAFLEASLSPLNLPNLTRWVAWARNFVNTLNEVDHVRARSKLDHGSLDRTPPSAEDINVFKANITANMPLDRTSSRLVDPGDKRTRLKIFPLSVTQVLPSGYEAVVEKLSRGEDASGCPLASRPGDIVQLVMKSMGDSTARKGCFAPHMFTNKHLFEADADHHEQSMMHGTRTGCVSSDMTVHVKSPPNSVFEETLHDSNDTTTVLLDINDSVCLYDCIRIRKEFRRGPATLGEEVPEYVVCFYGDEDRKRPREE